jgi:hypothetical protein
MTTTYVEAPTEYDGPGPSLFLAGGISGTHDWQAEVVERLADLPLVLLNPRRRNFPMDGPSAAEGQIAWEFRHLRRATAVLFWFPPETLCPIALFELGGRTMVREQPLGRACRSQTGSMTLNESVAAARLATNPASGPKSTAMKHPASTFGLPT